MYTKETLPLFDKLLGPTRYNQEQITKITSGLENATPILDLGVGLGNLADALVRKGKQVYGIDKNPASIRYAITKVNSGLFIPLLMDVHALGFEEGSFEAVSCLSNLTEFHSPETVVRGIYQVLWPGGYVAITGVEESQKENYKKKLSQETIQLLERGQLTLTPEEKNLLQRITVEINSQQRTTVDSLSETRELFQHAGLEIREEEMFYDDTCYFLLAQKPVNNS